MAKKFGIYFQTHDDSGKYHAFAPGDNVPRWLTKKVGDHVLAGAAQAKPAESEDDTGNTEGQQVEPADATEEGKEDGDGAADEPDFTKPAEEAKDDEKAAAKKG